MDCIAMQGKDNRELLENFLKTWVKSENVTFPTPIYLSSDIYEQLAKLPPDFLIRNQKNMEDNNAWNVREWAFRVIEEIYKANITKFIEAKEIEKLSSDLEQVLKKEALEQRSPNWQEYIQFQQLLAQIMYDEYIVQLKSLIERYNFLRSEILSLNKEILGIESKIDLLEIKAIEYRKEMGEIRAERETYVAQANKNGGLIDPVSAAAIILLDRKSLELEEKIFLSGYEMNELKESLSRRKDKRNGFIRAFSETLEKIAQCNDGIKEAQAVSKNLNIHNKDLIKEAGVALSAEEKETQLAIEKELASVELNEGRDYGDLDDLNNVSSGDLDDLFISDRQPSMLVFNVLALKDNKLNIPELLIDPNTTPVLKNPSNNQEPSKEESLEEKSNRPRP